MHLVTRGFAGTGVLSDGFWVPVRVPGAAAYGDCAGEAGARVRFGPHHHSAYCGAAHIYTLYTSLCLLQRQGHYVFNVDFKDCVCHCAREKLRNMHKMGIWLQVYRCEIDGKDGVMTVDNPAKLPDVHMALLEPYVK